MGVGESAAPIYNSHLAKVAREAVVTGSACLYTGAAPALSYFAATITVSD